MLLRKEGCHAALLFRAGRSRATVADLVPRLDRLLVNLTERQHADGLYVPLAPGSRRKGG